MNISIMNQRIFIEKSILSVDSVGNHTNTWVPHFSCYAYVGASSYKQKEAESAGITDTSASLVFSLRYCSEVSSLNTTQYRLRFQDQIYNIQSIDWMNYQSQSLKITAQRERGKNHGK